MARSLSDTALRLLDDLPPFEQSSKDIQGVLDVSARELDRLDAAVVSVRDNFFPQSADMLLPIYEQILGLPVAPAWKSTAQRKSSVMAFLRKLRSSGSAVDWVENLTALIGTGWTWDEHDPADGSSPPAYTLKVLMPLVQALSTPTAPTATPSTTGGTLTAGTYLYAITATNVYGETTRSPTTSATTTGSTSSVSLTWTAVAGATGYKVYRGTTVNNLVIIASPTTNSQVDTSPASFPVSPPLTNTTESFQAFEARQLLRAITPAHLVLDYGNQSGFIVGSSIIGTDVI
jgi:hypothetical protein